MEYFDIYNRYGEKTGGIVSREDAHRNGVCHRVVQLWIMNSQGQLLLQQRSAAKDMGANLWHVSVGGHIASGESIKTALLRETLEELGLDLSPLTDSLEFLFTFYEERFENGHTFGPTFGPTYHDREFYNVFLLRADIDPAALVLQPEEVQAVRYVDYSDFRAMVRCRDPKLWYEDGYPLLLATLDGRMGIAAP